MNLLARLRPDPFTAMLVGMALLSAVLPISGEPARLYGLATKAAIALLFFLHGVRLPREAVVAGIVHWRLHLTVFAATYVLFPLFGLAAGLLPDRLLDPALAAGILFLCCLPSTVQSSIAFTSMAGGNIPAAVCSASASNLIGVALTPLLVAVLMQAEGGAVVSFDSVQAVVLQLLVPFAIGQALHGRLGGWAGRNKRLTMLVDRGSILMVVYGAFSEAMVHGLWSQISGGGLLTMVVIDVAMLAAALVLTRWAARRLNFSRADEIAIVFCGSKKSLASGVPIANILFSAQAVGMIVLPLMLYHQIQLMACAVLARRYAHSGH
jgi:sodium/bile acid cotransporter 7